MAERIIDLPTVKMETDLRFWLHERIVRCRDCRWAHEVPPVEDWHLECRVRPLCRHYTPDTGFCHMGEPKEES